MTHKLFYEKHKNLVQIVMDAPIDTNDEKGIQKPDGETALMIIFDICNPNYGVDAKDYGLDETLFTEAKADYLELIRK